MAGLNPHPPLASFPFVLGIVLLVLELCARRSGVRGGGSGAVYVLALAAIVTPLTYLSGYTGASFADQAFVVPPAAIGTHQAFGKFLLLVLFLVVALGFARPHAKEDAAGVIDGLYLGALLLFLGVAAWTSFLGGELVFRHGAGVSTDAIRPAP